MLKACCLWLLAQVSWCKLEVKLAGPKAVTALPPGGAPPPQLTVAALNLKTWLNPASGASEVVAASVVHLTSMRMDAPFPKVCKPLSSHNPFT